jgi:superfamily II DNA or RNA helicase
MLLLETPTKVFFENYPNIEVLKPHLEFQDLRLSFEIQKLRGSKRWFVRQYGPEAYDTKLQNLKDRQNRTLLLQENDRYYTYSGLSYLLANNLQDVVVNQVVYPKQNVLPYTKPFPYVPREFQCDTVERLINVRHGYAELATGLGKSLIIAMLAKELGLKTLILAPSINIANNLTRFLQTHLGPAIIGRFFDGKKESKKLIVVGIGPSLTKVESGDHWDNFQKTQVFISDEAHTLPATIFEYVCMKLVAGAPYRFFLTATALRNDGLDLILKGIIGREVYSMDLQTGIKQGFLAKPAVHMFQVESHGAYSSKDANKMTRQHLFLNPKVNKIAATLANKAVEHGKSVLILIEEFEQFNRLFPLLHHKVCFAHGLVKKERVLPQFIESDTSKLVDQFNDGEFDIMVGTSAVATGTDFKRNQVTINLTGGKSEIQLRQGAIGRSTRLMPEVNKTSCLIFDFDIIDIPTLHRHAEARRRIYEREIGTPVIIRGGGL